MKSTEICQEILLVWRALRAKQGTGQPARLGSEPDWRLSPTEPRPAEPRWICLPALLLCLAFSAQAWQGSERLDAVVSKAVEEGTTPGAVLVVGHRGEIVHRKAYGSRSLIPEREPMTLDTIFDCASLTKVVVTAPSIMLLVEEGKLRLSDPVTKHLPEFAGGRSPIRIQDLLTHYSGLRPDLDLKPEWSGYETGVRLAYRETPIASLRSRFIYSDINYVLLAEVVRKISGESLDEFAAKRIFTPLGMGETGFRPPAALRSRVAPTERLPDGTILRGVVHDPTTRYMGGIAGHAGMFSTADDLARFAQMMLDLGRLGGRRVLSPLTVLKMTTPQSPRDQPVLRGLGWDIDSPYSSTRGDLFPWGSYGHTGYTGTSIWIDPFTKTYVILLTNRVHPQVKTSVVSLRSHVASVAAAALDGFGEERIREVAFADLRAGAAEVVAEVSERQVLTGLDVLVRDGFKPFAGKSVGLITNHTGIDRRRRRNVDLFQQADGVALKAIFSPEHGFTGRLDQAAIGDSTDPATGVPIFSLYQEDKRRPTPESLQALDALVFDIQDIGARFYTYATTMAYAMEEAAKHGIPFYVLDRPNPITGRVVEGPMLDESLRSFIGYRPMPVRHGMTIGELARLFNEENKIGARLEVIRMEGWRRDDWFDETGLPWVNPSPNIRTLEQALLYPGIALLEGLRNYSVGRGTDTPFQFIGADWIQGIELAAALNGQGLRSVRFYPVRRTPNTSRFQGTEIEGVQISVPDRDKLLSTRVGLEIAAALVRLYPDRPRLDETAKLWGNEKSLRALSKGESPAAIWAAWESEVEAFRAVRRRYLLY